MKYLYVFFVLIFTSSLFGTDVLQESNISKVDTMSILNILSFSKILWTIFFFILTYIAISLFSKILIYFSEKSSQLRITLKSFIPIIRIFLWIIFIFIIIKEIYHPPKIFLSKSCVAKPTAIATEANAPIIISLGGW